MDRSQSSTLDSLPRMNGSVARQRKTTLLPEARRSLSEPQLPLSSTPSERFLVRRAIAGDPDAQELLFKAHSAKLYRTACKVLRNKEDAEDALQNCWLRAFTKLSSFEERSSLSTWLTRILLNCALMILRKNRGVPEVPMDDQCEGDEVLPIHLARDASPDPEKLLLACERKETLQKVIRKLRPGHRVVLEVAHLREHSVEETARALGISTMAAKGRLFHARAKLRRSNALKAIAKTRTGRAA